MNILQQCLIALIVSAAFVGCGALLIKLIPFWWNIDLYSVRTTWLCIAGGLLGGGIYMARGFYQSHISKERPFDFGRYWWWYCFRLLLGPIAGGLAAVLLMLAVDLQETVQNLMVFFLLGVLSGFNFTNFINTRITKANL